MSETGLRSNGKGLGEGGGPGHQKATATSGVKLTSQGRREAGRGRQRRGGQAEAAGRVCRRVFSWPWVGRGGLGASRHRRSLNGGLRWVDWGVGKSPDLYSGPLVLVSDPMRDLQGSQGWVCPSRPVGGCVYFHPKSATRPRSEQAVRAVGNTRAPVSQMLAVHREPSAAGGWGGQCTQDRGCR